MKLRSKKSVSLESTLDVIGDKWTALLVAELLREPSSFCDLEKQLEGISPRTLSQRLDELEAKKIIDKHLYCEHPPRYRYGLTRKGEDLKKIINTMAIWGARYR